LKVIISRSTVFSVILTFLKYRACLEAPECGYTNMPSITAILSLQYYNIRRFVSHARLPQLNGFYPVTPPSNIHDLLPFPTGHIQSHTLATRKRESAAHAPQSFRKHTTIELSVTGIRLPAYPYRIPFLSNCAVSLGSLLFSQRPVSSGILNLAERPAISRLFTRQQGPLDKRDDSRGWTSGGVLSPCVD
jgi:hypothetical protein